MKSQLLIITLLLCSLSLPAQIAQKDYDFVKNSNPWLGSSNSAGLGTLQTSRISIIRAEFGKGDGCLISSYDSDNSLQAGISTESFVKLSNRLSFKGMLAYSFFNGKNMGGQMLLDPSYNLVNFVESDPGNSGTKVREFFSLNGGIAYSFSPKWSLGFDFDYQSGYSAKRKDLRPFSNWMDMTINLGGRFAASDGFAAGLNLEYRRTNEKAGGSIYGTTDKMYYSLVDYGGYWGSQELMSAGSNTTFPCGAESVSTKPVFNEFFGASLQLSFGKADNILFFNEIAYSHRSGHYGERTNKYNSLEYFKHSGNILSYNGVLNINRASNLHKIRLYATYEGAKNFENIYRFNSSAGQSTTVEYYGEKEVLNRTDINAQLSYTGYMGIRDFRPVWEYGAALDAACRNQLASIYPYYRKHNYVNISASVYGKRNLTYGVNIFSLELGAAYMSGFG